MAEITSGSIAYYASTAFQVLLGQFKVTYGISSDLEATPEYYKLPHHMNHASWNSFQGNIRNLGNPALFIDWGLEFEGASETYEIIQINEFINNGNLIKNTNRGKRDLMSLKKHSLFRIDLVYKLSDWIDFGLPVYYFGRDILSSISREKYNFPIADENDNILWYNYSDHVFSFHVIPSFYLVGFFGWEKHVFAKKSSLRPRELLAPVDPIFPDQDQVIYNPLYLEHIEMSEIGYGTGFDWDIKGNIGIFLRIRWFEHRDKYRPYLNFDGYRVKFTTYYSFE